MSSKQTDKSHLGFSLRLASLYTLFLATSFLILFFTTYHWVDRVVQMRDHKVIQAQAEQFKVLFSSGGVDAISNYFHQQINPTEPIFVRIVDRNRQIRFITVSHPLWDLLDVKMRQGEQPVAGESRWDELAREEKDGSWMVGTIRLNNFYFLQVGRSTVESQLVLHQFQGTSLRILIPALILSLLGGWLAAHGTLAPLKTLAGTIYEILETGDHKRRVPLRGQRGEFGILSILFNRVLDQNETLVQSSKETLDNVAHDLRTPMTHLRNSAEHALQMSDPDPVVQREALADCMEESERILQMLNTLMDLAEANVGGMTITRESIGLREFVDDLIELYALVAEDRHIALRNEISPQITIEADPMRLRQCLANLIDNALKYSDDHGDVLLCGDSKDDEVIIGVQDQGCGIAPEDLDRIWDRLYRGERSRATPGLGLGLSMVSAIAVAHGGSVQVHSQPNEGAMFTLKFPRV
jgi:signal transduction histidine kinase